MSTQTPKVTTQEYDTTSFLESIKAELPEDNPVDYLLNKLDVVEKRRRDTQASYTKTRQDLLKTASERDLLKQKVIPAISQTPEMEELMYSDPVAWREEMNRLEQEASKNIEQELQTAAEKTAAQFELEERQRILRSFSEANPDFDITKPEVQDQIPPRYLKQLESGNITFEAFLNKVKKFVEAPKTAAADIPEVKDDKLANVAGRAIPSSEGKKTIDEEYSNLVL